MMSPDVSADTFDSVIATVIFLVFSRSNALAHAAIVVAVPTPAVTARENELVSSSCLITEC